MPSRPEIVPAVPSPPPVPRVHGKRGQYQPAYVTRKRLEPSELATAIGAAVSVGLVCFYFAKVWLERTPLLPQARPTASADGEREGTVNRTVTPQRAAT